VPLALAPLSSLPLFHGIDPAVLLDLAADFVLERRARGDVIFHRGDPGDTLYVVLEGQVLIEQAIIEQREPGDPEVVAVCGPGNWFGELAVLTGRPRSADARVTLDALLLCIDRGSWSALAERAPRIFALVCERLSHQLRAASEPRARARRMVVACTGDAGDPPSWVGPLAASIRRQFPGREVHVLGPEAAGTLASVGAADAVVMLHGPDATRVADHRLRLLHDAEWVLEPGPRRSAAVTIRADDSAAALDRVERHLAGGTIGLALGAGGAYGLAHLGLLQVLLEAGVPIDYVAGTSMGAIVGAAFAAGVPLPRLCAFADAVSRRYATIVLRDLDLRGTALLRGTGVARLLGELDELRSATFEGLQLPFAAVAMDVHTGEEVLVDAGPVLDGIVPSFAMPGIFPACTRGAHVLVDGAMSNPVPVDRVRALGADFVIASQPIPPLRPGDASGGRMLGTIRRLGDFVPLWRLRHVIDTLDVSIRSFQALWHRLASTSGHAADVLVAPDLGEFSFLQFGAAAQIVDAGARSAQAVLPAIRAELERRRGLVLGEVPSRA